MAPGQVLFDQAGLGRGKVGGKGIGKSTAVRGLERGTSFGEVRAPYLQARHISFYPWSPRFIQQAPLFPRFPRSFSMGGGGGGYEYVYTYAHQERLSF